MNKIKEFTIEGYSLKFYEISKDEQYLVSVAYVDNKYIITHNEIFTSYESGLKMFMDVQDNFKFLSKTLIMYRVTCNKKLFWLSDEVELREYLMAKLQSQNGVDGAVEELHDRGAVNVEEVAGTNIITQMRNDSMKSTSVLGDKLDV